MRERYGGLVVCGFLVGLFAVTVRAQATPDAGAENIARVLIERGYENVAVRVTHGEVVVWCENRRIRFPAVWMLEALTVAAERVSSETLVRVFAQRDARTVTCLEAGAEHVLSWADGRTSSAAFRGQLDVEYEARSEAPERKNSSLGRFDLLLGPGRLLAEFGVGGGVFIRSLVDVSSAVEVTAAPGLTGYAQVFVPIHVHKDPIGDSWRYNEIRPGTMLVRYFRSFGSTGFATVTVGAYELASVLYDSYGAMFDAVNCSPDGHWSFGLRWGYLGSGAYFLEDEVGGRYRVWQMAVPPDRLVYLARVGYRFTGVDLRMVAQWGKFLGGDRGWRLDVERKFGEIGVTFYGIKSDGEAFRHRKYVNPEDTRLLGGFRLEIPLAPRRRGMPAPLRVTSNSSFRWSYRYRVGDVGIGVQTRYSVTEQIGEYNPVTILNNLDRVRPRISRD